MKVAMLLCLVALTGCSIHKQGRAGHGFVFEIEGHIHVEQNVGVNVSTTASATNQIKWPELH